MILLPAIDIKDGKVVRWVTGDSKQEIQYGDDPIAFARSFEEQGAEWLHLIDLEGAVAGKVKNSDIIARIRKETKLKIEFGGGLRTKEAIQHAIDLGVDRAILGTKALDPNFLKEMLQLHGDKVGVSLDTQDGMVRISGWLEESEFPVERAIEQLKQLNLKYLVFTDISKDGMLQGPNLKGLAYVLDLSGDIQVTLSGGIATLEDIQAAASLKHSNLYGVITGRALYEGRFTVAEALAAMQSKVDKL